MAYTQRQRREIFNDALANVQSGGKKASDWDIYYKLADRFAPKTELEETQLRAAVIRARSSVELAQRMRANPDVRPRDTSYPVNPGASASSEGYTYYVVVRAQGLSTDELPRGLFVVNSATRLTGAQAEAQALAMSITLNRGDPYFQRFEGVSPTELVSEVVAAYKWEQ